MKTSRPANVLILTTFVCFSIWSTIPSFFAGAQAKPSSTNVSGVISEDTDWTLDGSPYIVTGSILVQEGITLTIEPGVEVRFDGAYRLQIEGQLIAVGLPDSRITFTSNRNPQQPDDWLGITFTDTSVDAIFDAEDNYLAGSSIQFSDMTYGGTLLAYHSAPFISNNRFAYNLAVSSPYLPHYPWDTAVLTFWTSGNARITYNVLDHNSGGAIKLDYDSYYGYGGPPIVSRNIVYKNGGGNWAAGITDLRANAIIRNNVLADNHGFQFPGGYFCYEGNPLIENNAFIENTSISMLGGDDRGGGALGTWSRNLNVRENMFARNGGMAAIHLNQVSTDMLVNQNNFIGNTAPYEIYVSDYALSQGSTIPISATNNYWATSDEAVVASRIHNAYNEFGQPIVAFSPFTTTAIITAPVSPPIGVTVTPKSRGGLLSWLPNPEPDIAGYKVYYDTDAGYPYANVIDVGNVTTATLSNLSPTFYYMAITAYDISADGVDDWVDGNESWFSNEVLADFRDRVFLPVVLR